MPTAMAIRDFPRRAKSCYSLKMTKNVQALFVRIALVVALAGISQSGMAAAPAVASLAGQLKTTTVESIEFNEVTLEAGLEFLSAKSGGTPFLILGGGGEQGLGAKSVTMSMRGVSAETVLQYLCRLSNCTYRTERHAVLVGSIADLRSLDQLRRSNPPLKAGWPAVSGLQTTPLSSFDLQQTPISDVLELLRQKSGDTHAGKLTNIIILEDRQDPGVEPAATRTVTMKLGKVSALTALQYATELCGLGFRADYSAFVVGTPERVAFEPANKIPENSPIHRFLSATRIEKVRFAEVGIKDAIEAVRYYSGQASAATGGLNVIDAVGESAAQIDLQLDDVSLADLVRYVTAQSGTRVTTRGMTLIFEPDPAAVERGKKVGGGGPGPDAGKGKQTSTAPRPGADEGLRFDK